MLSPYNNQPIDLPCKPIDRFLYDIKIGPNPFHSSVAFHIEIGHLIRCANQMTSVYMKYSTLLIRVKLA